MEKYFEMWVSMDWTLEGKKNKDKQYTWKYPNQFQDLINKSTVMTILVLLEKWTGCKVLIYYLYWSDPLGDRSKQSRKGWTTVDILQGICEVCWPFCISQCSVMLRKWWRTQRDRAKSSTCLILIPHWHEDLLDTFNFQRKLFYFPNCLQV